MQQLMMNFLISISINEDRLNGIVLHASQSTCLLFQGAHDTSGPFY